MDILRAPQTTNTETCSESNPVSFAHINFRSAEVYITLNVSFLGRYTVSSGKDFFN